MLLDRSITVQQLQPNTLRVAALAAQKTTQLLHRWKHSDGAPVITVAGRYTSRNWTQWTQGFLYGSGLLAFEMTDDRELLDLSRNLILSEMADHITHTGVHDHGFNCVSTYGNLRRLVRLGRIESSPWEMNFYELALKASGAVQASRWTKLPESYGYIHSFNGAHSLFVDTFRTLRICGLAHQLGHTLYGEQDLRISLLDRLMTHAITSSRYNIYYGEGRDIYDAPGRTVHEAVFNPASGAFRCPSTQQGYSPFTTWTRGLAWAMLGATEQIEFLQSIPEDSRTELFDEALKALHRCAKATCDFYIREGAAADGICYWDTGAPGLAKLGEWVSQSADPFNAFEPVDASASAIAAQALLRFGNILGEEGSQYTAAGLTVARTLFQEPYLSTSKEHEGLLLHSIYHRPNGWDHAPVEGLAPHGESSMWGDYHLLELALLIHRTASGEYYTFFE
jgi:unsaturated chondroitin disaccharide hydrolase